MTMRVTVTVTAAVLAATLLLGGCGGGDDADQAALASSAPGSTAAGGGQSKGEMDAEAVFAKLKAAGLPVKLVEVYTEDSDPNRLMGRPGGYTSKLSFTDARVSEDDGSGGEGDTSYGGGIEVFATEKAAKARRDYIAAFAENMPLVAEYTFAVGKVVLRVSHVLTPKQAEEYKAAVQG